MPATFPRHEDEPMREHEQTLMFALMIEPHLHRLRCHQEFERLTREIPELEKYLEVCHWPYRKVEYAFALQFLLAYLKPDDLYLDAGCGASLLPTVIANQEISTKACDIADKLIRRLTRPTGQVIYGTKVSYMVADLTQLHYASDSFDAISCTSVLDHLPVPKVWRAVQELMRVLKPGGLLVITLGFQVIDEGCKSTSYRFCTKLLAGLVNKGMFNEIYGESLVVGLDVHTQLFLADEQEQREIQTMPPLTLALQKPY